MILKYAQFITEKSFNDMFGIKDQWVELDKNDLRELKDNMYFLIDGAYGNLEFLLYRVKKMLRKY